MFERQIKVKMKCAECKSDEKPHKAKGLCENCYARVYQKDWRGRKKEEVEKEEA